MCILSRCMTCPKLLLYNASFFKSGNLWKEECVIVESNAHSSILIAHSICWIQCTFFKFAVVVAPNYIAEANELSVKSWCNTSFQVPTTLQFFESKLLLAFWVVVANLHGHQQLCSSHVPKLHPSGNICSLHPVIFPLQFSPSFWVGNPQSRNGKMTCDLHSLLSSSSVITQVVKALHSLPNMRKLACR